MTLNRKALSLAVITAALLAGPALLKADPSYGAPAMSGEAAPQVSSQQKELFVEAFSQVQQLQVSFTQQLEGVTSQEEAQALQQQTQQRMVEAVEATGLSVADYNHVVAAMEQDPVLRDRILEQVQ